VNADGTVNDQDLLILVQYLARLGNNLPSAEAFDFKNRIVLIKKEPASCRLLF